MVVGEKADDDDCKNRNEYNGIAVDGIAEVHQNSGKSGHFRTELNEDLIEDRHDFDDQYEDNNDHHADNDHWISDSAADRSGNGIFTGIVVAEGGHDIVQCSGFFTDPDHTCHISRKKLCLFQCFVQ